MKNISTRALLLVTLIAPSAALAATPDSSSTPPVKHHRRMDGAVRAVIGGIAGQTHGAPAPSASAPSVSSNGATGGAVTPGSSVPVPGSSASGTQPGRGSSTHAPAPSRPAPRPVTGGSSDGGFGRDGNGGSGSGSVGGSSAGISGTLSQIEQAIMVAAYIAQLFRADVNVNHPHIPLPGRHPQLPSTRGSPTTGDTTVSDGSDDSSSDDSSADDSSGDDSGSDDSGSDVSADDSSSTQTASNEPGRTSSAPNGASTNAAANAPGSVATGKSGTPDRAPNGVGSVASSSDSTPTANGTPLRSPASADPSSTCPISKTKLPSVLDGTNAYCPTCVKGALDKLGDGVAQAEALSGGAMRERDTIEQIVHIEETGVASGDYGAMSADGGKLEYGAYQFSRASGQLQGVLRAYVQMKGADSKSADLLKSYLHQLESGAPLVGDHVFTDALRQAAKDPMMKKAQDAYFEREYLVPAIADASKMGLRSPLAAAILVDLKTNGGYESVVAAAKKSVSSIANADDEKKFLAALLDARDARYKALGAKPAFAQYLKTWLARDKDFRNILASGNTDLAGEVKLASGTFCGGNGDDSRAFGIFMAKQQQGTSNGSSTSSVARL